jgi:hypothetical protein
MTRIFVILLAFGLTGCAALHSDSNAAVCRETLTVTQVRENAAAYDKKQVCVGGFLGGSFELAGLFPTQKAANDQDLSSVVEIPGWGQRISRGELKLGGFLIVRGIVQYPKPCWNVQTGEMVTECSPVKRPMYLRSASVVSD